MKKIILSLLLLPGIALGNQPAEQTNDELSEVTTSTVCRQADEPKIVDLVQQLWDAQFYQERVSPALGVAAGISTFPVALYKLFKVAESASNVPWYKNHVVLHQFVTIPCAAGCIAATTAFLCYKAINNFVIDDPATVKEQIKRRIIQADGLECLTETSKQGIPPLNRLGSMKLSILKSSKNDAGELHALLKQKISFLTPKK